VAATIRSRLLLVVRGDLPVTDFAGFVAHLRAHPGKLNLGSPGTGTGPHIAAEMLMALTKTTATHVPYKGSALVVQDMLGGSIDWPFDPGPSFPHVQSGKLRGLAVSGLKRYAQFPDIPTLAEVGLPDFDVSTTSGLWAPAGTPAPIIERLNREVNRLLVTPAVIEGLSRVTGGDRTPMSPAEFLAVTQADRAHFARMIREGKITVN
jgi:tripartite-type tricarboxylate transporter receptor subunit TctC